MKQPKLFYYYLPSEKGEGWAMIVIGDNGFFSAVSDYGSYGYLWTHHGMPDVRMFFLKCKRQSYDSDYFQSKLYPRPWDYDAEKTYQNLRHFILGHRRHGGFTKDEARREWDLLHDHGVRGGGVSEHIHWYGQTQIDCAFEHTEYSPPSNLVAFCDKTLPRLARLIEVELFAERYAAWLAEGSAAA